jgi:hypothetical protein
LSNIYICLINMKKNPLNFIEKLKGIANFL